MIGASGVTVAALQPAISDVISLSGTTGSPNTSTDFAISTNDASVGWWFNSDGTIDRLKLQGADSFEWGYWCNPAPIGDYWIRFTHNASDNANGSSSSTGSWLAMTSATNQTWLEITNGFATTSGSSKAEISSDASGSPIVATGYYGGSANVEI